MGVNLYTSFQKYRCFWLPWKTGSTYTRIDLYTRKYGKLLNDVEVLRQKWEKVHLYKLIHLFKELIQNKKLLYGDVHQCTLFYQT